MYEWEMTLEQRIDYLAEKAKAEIRAMVDQAIREMDARLGLSPLFTARSLGQRRRRARERQLKG